MEICRSSEEGRLPRRCARDNKLNGMLCRHARCLYGVFTAQQRQPDKPRLLCEQVFHRHAHPFYFIPPHLFHPFLLMNAARGGGGETRSSRKAASPFAHFTDKTKTLIKQKPNGKNGYASRGTFRFTVAVKTRSSRASVSMTVHHCRKND